MGLGLLSPDGALLNAAVVLFGRADRMMARFTQCQLRMARFRGTAKDEFLDNRQEIGNAFELFVRAQRFMRDHLPIAGRIVPNLFERIDDPLYPTEALREALANALCHRDYSIGGGAVTIGVFDDRLEIGSAGPLPFGQTVESLESPHPSRPWNPLIAQTFYRRGLIEQWGRGTTKMITLVRAAGLVAPVFLATKQEVIVTFRPSRYLAPTRVSLNLTPVQQVLHQLLSELGPASLRQLMRSIPDSTPERTVQDNLQTLRRMGMVHVDGTRRAARWSLTSAH